MTDTLTFTMEYYPHMTPTAAQGRERSLQSDPVDSDLFRRPCTAERFNCIYQLLWLCQKRWLFNRQSVNTSFHFPEKLLFKITNSRRSQIMNCSFWGLIFLVFCFDFGKIEGFSRELISYSDGWFFSHHVYNLRMVEYGMSC